jgi:hypothetical protein
MSDQSIFPAFPVLPVEANIGMSEGGLREREREMVNCRGSE